MGLTIKKDDQVIVLSGDDVGKVGRVLTVFPKKRQVIVEGIKMVKRHAKAQGQKQGGIREQEAAIPISKVMLLDPKTGIRTRFRNAPGAEGVKVRKAAQSGNEI